MTKHGKKLRELREKKGLTQKKLAELSGQRQATISDIENDNRSYELQTLEKIVEPLGKAVEIKFVKLKK